jgi:hypothetical protein
MQEFILHETNKSQFWSVLKEKISTGKRWRIEMSEYRAKRSIPQNSLSHMWYAEISKQLVATGRDYCTPEWVKRNLKKTFLGYREVEYTDLKTGEVETRRELKKTSELDTGDMHYYLQEIEDWCFSMGIELTIPENCEYRELQRRQNA